MITEKAHAKLNLNLHILPDLEFKKRTGYYSIHFINCELELHDNLVLENLDGRITFTCDKEELSNNENLIYKAACLLKKELSNSKLGAKITLQKRIPIKAGFGGGSSDAAATIRGLLKLWDVTLTQPQLNRIIDSLGSDVFYFMQGGLAEVSGKGEKVDKIGRLPKLWTILIIPPISKPSTSWMYKNIDLKAVGLRSEKIDKLKQAILSKKKPAIFNFLHNDFEDIIKLHYPNLETIKRDLANNGSIQEHIAGSGLSIVGFYKSKQAVLAAYTKLHIKYRNIVWTHTK